MPWILPKGTYYDATDHVAKGSIECSERPSDNHVLKTGWELDPMDPMVCWRPKEQAELDAEEDAEVRARYTEREDTNLLLLWELTNDIRVLQGKQPIDKPVFWEAVKVRHKTQQFFDGSF